MKCILSTFLETINDFLNVGLEMIGSDFLSNAFCSVARLFWGIRRAHETSKE